MGNAMKRVQSTVRALHGGVVMGTGEADQAKAVVLPTAEQKRYGQRKAQIARYR